MKTKELNTINEQNLKPCPFCGSTKIDIGVDIINGQYTIDCEECRASISFPWKDEKASTKAWNRRTAGCVSEQITPQSVIWTDWKSLGNREEKDRNFQQKEVASGAMVQREP